MEGREENASSCLKHYSTSVLMSTEKRVCLYLPLASQDYPDKRPGQTSEQLLLKDLPFLFQRDDGKAIYDEEVT